MLCHMLYKLWKLDSLSAKWLCLSNFLGDGAWMKFFLCCSDECAHCSRKDGCDQLMLSKRVLGNARPSRPSSFCGKADGFRVASRYTEFVTPCVCVAWSSIRTGGEIG